MNTIPLWRKVIYMIVAPVIIFVWSITHPKKVWEQAKKEYNL